MRSLSYFGIILLMLFISGCTSTTEPITNELNSSEMPGIITSTREFIRIRHRVENAKEAHLIAKRWCNEQNLTAEKSISSCSGSCITAYQCR
jgi:hypothetical protein